MNFSIQFQQPKLIAKIMVRQDKVCPAMPCKGGPYGTESLTLSWPMGIHNRGILAGFGSSGRVL